MTSPARASKERVFIGFSGLFEKGLASGESSGNCTLSTYLASMQNCEGADMAATFLEIVEDRSEAFDEMKEHDVKNLLDPTTDARQVSALANFLSGS